MAAIPKTTIPIEKRNMSGLLWAAFYRLLAAHSQAKIGLLKRG